MFVPCKFILRWLVLEINHLNQADCSNLEILLIFLKQSWILNIDQTKICIFFIVVNPKIEV